jgi:hypothetical protein
MEQVRALAAGFPQPHETISLLVPWRNGDAARERRAR